MRVLSFIPAFLLAAASFVAAAPASVPADTSCVSHSTGGQGNDAPLQPVIAIIANATAQIQPLNDKLAGLKGDSCTPDAVSGVVIEITAVVSDCITKLQATAQVDLTSLDLDGLYGTISVHLKLVVTVLNILVTVILTLGAKAIGTVDQATTNLLHAVITLVGCFKMFVTTSRSDVLGPVFELVCSIVDLLLVIVGGLVVSLGVHA